MRKLALLIFCMVFLQACNGGAENSKVKIGNVQESVVAGKFYPESENALKSDIDKYLAGADVKPVSGNLMGIVVPHAGFKYSGPVAAYGFKQLIGKKYDYVVVIAPSHHDRIPGAGTRLVKSFETPLGKIPVATDVVKKLVKKYKWIVPAPGSFSREHSLDVELPFLQTVLKDFKLIPLLIGTLNLDVLYQIAGSLNEEFLGKNVLYVISTDLSHYHPYAKANKMDKMLLSFITGEKYEDFLKSIQSGACEMCGFGPLVVMLNLYKMAGGGRIELLKYANSGDTAGDKSKVVGYASLAVVSKFDLSDSEKSKLLDIARETLIKHVNGKKVSPPRVKDKYLMKPGAPFVTLKKNGQLRGCIGHIVAREPLAKAVQANTIAAASKDPRFQPVRPDELDDISVEISVLTPQQPVFDPTSVVVGRDGLVIENGNRRGVLLPQVPNEAGWDLNAYLNGICRKAGLPPSAINDPKTSLFRFQALVFPDHNQKP